MGLEQENFMLDNAGFLTPGKVDNVSFPLWNVCILQTLNMVL